jgi:hypothetical protein
VDQLIKTVSEKSGISEDQARTAVQHVVDFLKDKLPAGLGNQLEGLMSSKPGESTPDMLGEITGKLGGMFGGGK